MAIGSEVKTAKAGFPPVVDGLLIPPRADRYGGLWLSSVSPSDMHHGEEGAYIVATNPTIGTGQTWVAAQTAFSDTAPNWYIFNPSDSRTIWLRRLKLQCSAVGTAAVSWRYAVIVDTVPRAIATDNTLAITPVSAGPTALLVSPTIKVQNSASVSVIAASSAGKRLVAIGTLGGLNIAGSEFEVIFGSTDAAGFSGVADAAGQPSRKVSHSGPVGIGPGGSAVIHVWGPTSSASINPEWEMGLVAR